jgi:hypothetical protein
MRSLSRMTLAETRRRAVRLMEIAEDDYILATGITRVGPSAKAVIPVQLEGAPRCRFEKRGLRLRDWQSWGISLSRL